MARSYGSATSLLIQTEPSYGAPVIGNFEQVSFVSSSLGAEQNLIASNLLGQGREPRAPFRDVINDSGDIVVPIDCRDFGKWLTFLLGNPASTAIAATGQITFAANPQDLDSITLNGVNWVFVSGPAGMNQTQIGATLADTLADLVSDLNTSSHSGLIPATYSNTSSTLNITYTTTGVAGNSYTLASAQANAVVSSTHLTGGGYNRQTVRACLEQLAAAYFFDCVESSGILRFIKRGGASRASIDVTALVASTDQYPLTITRTPELELPRQIDVIYIDSTTDYQAATQSAQRQTVHTQDYTTINLPLVLNAQAAKTIADITLYNAWISRVQYAFSLPPHYALLEPGDIITITDHGITHLLRILSSKIVRQGIAEITAIADDSTSYDFYRPAASPVGNSSLPPAQPSPPLVDVLDLPLLPGETEPSLHYALSSTSTWNGAVLYRSDDNGANYSVVRATMQESITGSTLSALSPGPAETWDETGSIEVLLRHGELQSISELGVLNGMNSCVIGHEIVQFQFAELVAPYKYRLSRLLRGRLGTEWAIADHLAGERFVLLNNSLIQESVTSAAIGITKPYKAVAVGQTLATTPAFDVTFAGNCFKPFAPVHVQLARDSTGNITLSWIRRTRVNGEWRDYVDVLLGESSEAYDIEIMDGSTVKRTLTSTVPMVMYPLAQQIADFGTAITPLHARIYQLSTTIGRGYPASYKED